MKEKRILLVTGGSRGIGKAIVDFFVEKDWIVATCATREENLVNSKANLSFACDVQNVEDVKKSIAKVVETYGHIDVLINNAGTAGTNPLAPDTSDDMWHKIINTNLNGSYYFCKYVAPHLPDHKGRIINISSVLGLKGVPDQIAYCAAKHGVVGLTRSLALYLAPRGITVNAICPGWVDTEMAEGRFHELGKTTQQIEETIPLGKIVSSKEIASLVHYLVDPMMNNVTGQTITIDGGAIL